MTRKSNTKRKPNNTNGKDSSLRGGLKTKQVKLTTPERNSIKAPQQTKLSFGKNHPTKHTTSTPQRLSDPTASITPEGRGFASLPTSTLEINDTTNTNKTPTRKTNSTKTTRFSHTYDSDTSYPPTNDTKRAAMPNAKDTTHQPTSDPDTTNEDHTNASITSKSSKQATKTAKSRKKSPPTPPGIYQEIRYRGIIEAPPSEKPFQDFVKLLRKYLLTVQDILGKGIHLAPWDKEQEATFPHLKRPADIPESRESLGIYLGTYINPKEEGSKIYMNLRWATTTEPPVPLERFGLELADALPKLKMAMNKQPQPCQAAKSCCIGWFMYSSKQMNSITFVKETKLALGIPDDVAIGISYRTIINEFGKRPQYDRDDPPAAAIHLDIDEKFYMVFQPKASSLWRKN